ncbi:unnamed protein product [Schistosoma mattheei]|uniref:Uncharacterized protein n=1 Tax=Schistosoma mattheei TaxID=31246 RepID=A0A183PI89_9TREM|nr:unnamed protein product [Schistosoma mattheei]
MTIKPKASPEYMRDPSVSNVKLFICDWCTPFNSCSN